jgi:predicted aconitase with swiveling domain
MMEFENVGHDKKTEDADGWTSIADVKPTEVEWLWKPYIPLGKVTLFDGDPGVGKSWASCALVAAVTTGNGLPGVVETEPRKVLMLSAEDGLSDTIRPRLEALGAELSRVVARPAMTLDQSGMEQLKAQVVRHKPALIIIDPLFAFVGGKKDIYRDNEARTVTTPLAELAQAHSCAIVAVRHLTKLQQKAIYAGGGSMAFIGAARSALLFGHDANNPQKFGFVHAKSNLAPKGGAIGYKIEGTLDGRGRFIWTGDTDLTAEQILTMPDCKGRRTSASSIAEDLLRDVLRNGEAPANEVFMQAERAGIAGITLRRAKRALNVNARRVSKGNHGSGEWVWELPKESA